MRKIFTFFLLTICLTTKAQWFTSTSTIHPTDISYGCAVLPNNTIFVTGVEGSLNGPYRSSIYKSTNNGLSFTEVKSLPGSSCERIKFWNNNIGVAVDNYSIGSSIVKTTNGGNSWTEYSIGLSNNDDGNVKDVFFLDSTIFYLTARYRIYKSVNFNNVPILINSPTTSGVIDEIQFLTSNLGFCSIGKLYKTINGGQNWENLTSSINGNLESVKFFDANNGLILYSDGRIYKTINGGQSWTTVRTAAGSSFYQLHFINPFVGYAVSGNEIIATTNGGQNWTSLQSFGLNFFLQNIFVNKNGVGIATGLPFGNYAYTTNFGSIATNTTVPTATISGFDSVCNNSNGSIRFDFSGSGPWNVTYNDGTTNFNLNNITTTPYFVTTTVTANKTYSITAFTNNGTASTNIFGKAYAKVLVSNQTAIISGTKSICTNDSAQITIRFTGSIPISFTYTDGTTTTTISNFTDSVYKVFVKPLTTKTFTLSSIKDVCNNNGLISGSAVITVVSAPLAPTNFALVDSNRKVLLTWIDNSTNEDSIVIERKIQGQTSFSRLKVLLPNITQYLDTNITYQKWYYYKVTFKKNNVTCVGVSNTDSIYADYPPSKFPITTLNSFGNNNIKNSVWFDVDNDGDQDIIFGNLVVYKNNGSDNFEYAYSLPNVTLDATNGSSIRVTDVNNDGKTDYFLLNATINATKKATVLTDNGNFNMGTGPFDYVYYYASQNDNYIDYINYNNVKRLDIVANYYAVINQPFNPSNGTYFGTDVYQGTTQSLPTPYNSALVRSKVFDNRNSGLISGKSFYLDVNNDRYQDMVILAQNGIHIVKFNNGNVISSKLSDSGTIGASSYNLLAADFDNNLTTEFISANSSTILQKFGANITSYVNFNSNYGDFNSTNVINAKSFCVEDFNNDGWQDIFMTFTNKQPLLFLNNKNKTFTKYDFGYIDYNQTQSVDIALADYNNDGKVDMAIGNKILKNTLPFNNNWLNIKVIPVSTNRIPYGTKIKLKATINGQPVWQQREIYAGANSIIAHFGLGNAIKADSIIIVWPNHSQTDSALRVSSQSNTTTLLDITTINQQVEFIEPTRVLQFLNFATTTTKASLKWNQISGANNYLLQRKKDGDTTFRQVYFGININFDDTTLLPNTTYLYKVSAFSSNDTITETVYATTNKINLNIMTNTNLTNQISWNTTESKIIKSRLFRKQSNGQFVFIKDAQSLNAFLDSPLIASTQYCYFIQSFYATDSNARSNTDTICVATVAQISLSAGVDVTKCPGKNTTLTATGASSYSWNTGATTASITVAPTTTTSYIVTGLVNGIQQKDTVVIVVDAVPNVFAGVDTGICNGQSILLNATGADVYSWIGGTGISTYLVTPIVTTSYVVLGVSNTTVCSKYDTVTVTVKPLPNVAFTKILNGAQVQLTAPSGNTSYNWSFGDATANSTTQNPTHTYTSNGKFYITLNSILNGCSAQKTDSVNISITAINNNISFVDKISVYPNPTDNYVRIELNAKKSSTFNISLISVDGKIITTKEYNNTSVINDEIDFKNYSAGVYMLQIKSENEQATYQIIKK